MTLEDGLAKLDSLWQLLAAAAIAACSMHVTDASSQVKPWSGLMNIKEKNAFQLMMS